MSEEQKPQINTEGVDNSMATPFYGMIEEVRVVLVDHDKDFVTKMIDLLKSYKYKVRTVDMALEAMSMLSKGKEKVDVMIINVNSPDLLSFQLLDQAIALDIVSLVVCDEHHKILAKKALDNGAYLYLKKPLHEEIVKYLWQFVLKEKIQKKRAKEGVEENRHQMNIGDVNDIGNNNIIETEEQAGEKDLPNTEEQRNNIHEEENDVVPNGKYKLRRKRDRKSTKEINERESQNSANKVVRRKVCTKWTADLHENFMEAIQRLGEGRCFPKSIRNVMSVPGLTRLQVASHLQKCRNDNWRAPEERKFTRQRSSQESSSGSRQRSSFRKFGTMVHLQTNVTNLQQHQHNQETQRDPEFSFPLNTNNTIVEGESSTQQHIYRSQLQVDLQYLNINNLFNNSFYSIENNSVGGIQRQHEPLFEMSKGLQGSIIGSTYYRPGLEFNDGDHHVQNDYDLNVNAINIAPYSSSTMISGTDVENEIINELGTTNANFQHYIGEPNMSYPNNIPATSHASENVGSDSNEENYDVYFDFNNMDDLFQNLGPPSVNLPNEHGNKFD
ncbi:hypothetical protein RND71_040376 [Anisodus tanguticus]|uniref:Uncharacterized protein n=1 Tax=Anisodus tanguticus TaxID=243964 RepID=A0AAE1QTD4_9SOLA|nr:hypothetical protein RND71_040376 [Anisodus tanguticus]